MIIRSTDFGISDEEQFVMLDYDLLDHAVDKLTRLIHCCPDQNNKEIYQEILDWILNFIDSDPDLDTTDDLWIPKSFIADYCLANNKSLNIPTISGLSEIIKLIR
tara:strand:- start:3098 stop:3412 length:315 start_codon:yes stop_codon:yes gene_type:complete